MIFGHFRNAKELYRMQKRGKIFYEGRGKARGLICEEAQNSRTERDGSDGLCRS